MRACHFVCTSQSLTKAPTYPLEPPTMRFDPPIFHPNGACVCTIPNFLSLSPNASAVYPDGLVCISILHAAGDDPNSTLGRSVTYFVSTQCMSRPQNAGLLCNPLKKSCSPCLACWLNRTLRVVPTLTPVYVSYSELLKIKSCTYSHVHQKMYRDDRDAYEKTIRRQVQEQLGL